MDLIKNRTGVCTIGCNYQTTNMLLLDILKAAVLTLLRSVVYILSGILFKHNVLSIAYTIVILITEALALQYTSKMCLRPRKLMKP